jgi:hypothetical protein
MINLRVAETRIGTALPASDQQIKWQRLRKLVFKDVKSAMEAAGLSRDRSEPFPKFVTACCAAVSIFVCRRRPAHPASPPKPC